MRSKLEMPVKKKTPSITSISSRTRSKQKVDEESYEESPPPTPKLSNKKRAAKETKEKPTTKKQTIDGLIATSPTQEQKKTQYIEKGNVFFLYRPRLDHGQCHGLEDVQRMVIVLQAKETFPPGKHKFSSFPKFTKALIIPKKTLPHQTQREQRLCYIDSY